MSIAVREKSVSLNSFRARARCLIAVFHFAGLVMAADCAWAAEISGVARSQGAGVDIAALAFDGKAGPPTIAAQSAPPNIIAHALQPFVDGHRLAGAVVLIADRNRILDLEAVGFADVAARKCMQKDSLFWIASQSKSVTAAALMMLVDEGKVKLDDPVQKYLPQFAGILVEPGRKSDDAPPHRPCHPITIREILSHTSGLRFLNAKDKMVIDSVPLAKSVQHDLLEPLLFEPGSGYKYSNEGIDTAGLIIQVVSGMAYETFLQQRLFTPLEMKDTTFFPSAAQVARLAKSYKPDAAKSGLEETRIKYLKYPLDAPGRYPAPGGGLFSTAADVARFCQMLLNGGVYRQRRYLSQAAIAEMTKKQTGDHIRESYGLGFTVGAGTYGHGGANATNMSVDTRRGIITVFMVQHAGFPGDAKQMRAALSKAVEQVVARRIRD